MLFQMLSVYRSSPSSVKMQFLVADKKKKSIFLLKTFFKNQKYKIT